MKQTERVHIYTLLSYITASDIRRGLPNEILKGDSTVKFKAFFANLGAKISAFCKKAWTCKFNKVNSVVAWSVYGGVLALSVLLALIFWL